MLNHSIHSNHPPQHLPTSKASIYDSHLFTHIDTYQSNHHPFSSHQQDPSRSTNVYQQSPFAQRKQGGQTQSRQFNHLVSNQSNKLYSKLDELQQKTNKIIAKLPNIHSKMSFSRSRTHQVPQHIFSSEASTFSNKLKIIRQLQDKVQLLESNINNPHASSFDMLNIEKQINLNFQNYYQESKVNELHQKYNIQNSSLQNSFDSNDSQIQTKPRENKAKGSIVQKQVQIIIYLPKIIYVEVPMEVYLVPQQPSVKNPVESPRYHYQINKALLEEQLQHKNRDNSMEIIINDFHRFYENPCIAKHDYHNLKVSNVQPLLLNSDSEKDQFSLPLESMHKNRQENLLYEKLNLLKRTDRSTKSSNQEAEKIRDEIWNKDFIEFNHEHLSLVKEYQHRSEQNEDKGYKHDLDGLNLNFQMNTFFQNKIKILQHENARMDQKFHEKYHQTNLLKEQLKQLQQKMVQLQIQYLQQIQKTQQKEQEYHDLLLNNQQYKQQLQKREQQVKEYEVKLNLIVRQFNNKLQQKQNDLHDLLKMLHDKSQEMEEQTRCGDDIREMFLKKEKQMNQHINELEYKIHQLQQEIVFYKLKIQEEEIHVNQEDLQYIKNLTENKEKYQKENIKNIIIDLQARHNNTTNQLRAKNTLLQTQLQHLKGLQHDIVRNSISPQTKSQLQTEIKNLFDIYDVQLMKKEEEIKQLDRQFQNYMSSQQVSNEQQLKKILNIKGLFLNDKSKDEDHNVYQFIYIFDKLINQIKFHSFLLQREKEEKNKLSKKISTLNLYVNTQLEKAEAKVQVFQMEKNSQLSNMKVLQGEIYKLNGVLKVYKSKIVDDDVLQPKYTLYQLENQILLIQNSRIKEKLKNLKNYFQNLQSKMINDLLNEGSSLCQNFCQIKSKLFESEKIEQQASQTSIQQKLKEIHQYYSQSVINTSLSQLQHFSDSKINHLQLSIHSNNISFNNRPKPKKYINTQTMKALLAPLPIMIVPSHHKSQKMSIFLDKILVKSKFLNLVQKRNLSLKLLDLGIELVKVTKKLFSLKPSQILVNSCDNEIQVSLKREFGNGHPQQNENHLIYGAPQILLGFNETQASYVWSIGLIIDQIYHQKIFYSKINQVVSLKNNYEVRNHDMKIGSILQKMLMKNHKERPGLSKVKQELCLIAQF